MDSMGVAGRAGAAADEAVRAATIVERTFGWFNCSRRLSKDYERTTASSEAFIYVTMIRLMVRRLA